MTETHGGRNADRSLATAQGLVVRLVREHARLLTLSALGGALALGVLRLPATLRYRSEAVFTPQAVSASALRGLAAQFGLDAGAAANESPFFYADLILTDAVFERVATMPVHAGSGSTEMRPLVEYYGFGKRDDHAAIEKAIEKLRRRVGASADRRTGMVRVSVEDASAEVAQDIGRLLLTEVDKFNSEGRRTRAREERRFIAGRLDTARVALLGAEVARREFQSANRNYRGSPSLSLENERLESMVSRQQQLVTNLDQAFEQARLEEVRDTPVITVLQSPRRSNKRAWGGFLFRVLAGAVLGVFAAGGLVLTRRFLDDVAFLESTSGGSDSQPSR